MFKCNMYSFASEDFCNKYLNESLKTHSNEMSHSKSCCYKYRECRWEGFRFDHTGTQENTVYRRSWNMYCKLSVTSKQEGEGWSGVCEGVWSALLHHVPAELCMQLQLRDTFQFYWTNTRDPVSMRKKSVYLQTKYLLRLMMYEMTIDF